MGASTAAMIAGVAVIIGVLALIAYIVKKLGANVKTALLIAGIIIALAALLTRLPPIIEAFQAPPAIASPGPIAAASPGTVRF